MEWSVAGLALPVVDLRLQSMKLRFLHDVVEHLWTVSVLRPKGKSNGTYVLLRRNLILVVCGQNAIVVGSFITRALDPGCLIGYLQRCTKKRVGILRAEAR